MTRRSWKAVWALAPMVLATLVLLAGCGEEEKEEPRGKFNPLDDVPATAEAREDMLVTYQQNTQRRVQEFFFQHGYYPASLEELQEADYKIDRLPPSAYYHYDPSTGRVTIRRH